MEGLQSVLVRIGEIQKRINSLQPMKIKQFQQNIKAPETKPFKNHVQEALQNQSAYIIPKDAQIAQNMEIAAQAKKVPVGKEVPITKPKQVSRADILGIIKEASRKYKVPEALIKSVVHHESGFNPKAVSHAGAKGLMQLMPKTAKELKVTDIFDPRQNIFGGTKYLRNLMGHFKGNLANTLAAYNAGIGRVMNAGGVPNIRETKNYVKNVIHSYQKFKK